MYCCLQQDDGQWPVVLTERLSKLAVTIDPVSPVVVVVVAAVVVTAAAAAVAAVASSSLLMSF